MSCPSARGLRGFSPDIYYENVVEHLEVHLTILWGPPYNWIPLEFLPVKIVHIGLPAIHKLQCSSSYPGTGSYSSFCWASLLCKPWLPVFACLLLQFWGSWFTLCPLSPMNLSRVINFPVRSGFPCCEDGLATSKILTCGNRNWRLPKQLLTGRTRLKDFYCLFQDLPETYSNQDSHNDEKTDCSMEWRAWKQTHTYLFNWNLTKVPTQDKDEGKSFQQRCWNHLTSI